MEFIDELVRRANEVESAKRVLKKRLDAYLEVAEARLWEASRMRGGTVREFCALIPDVLDLQHSIRED